MSDEDISLDEKRVFEDQRGTATVFVAGELGLARVEVSDDQIGRFGLVHRGETQDVAVDTHEGKVAIATADDVLVGDGESFDPTGFGPAVAVTFADGLAAADPRGRIARRDGLEWTTTATVGAQIDAMDGDLVATAMGVYRIESTEDQGVALADVRDVASAGPFAATGGGIYRLAEGVWERDVEGDATAVAGSASRSAGLVDRTVLERTDEAGEWETAGCPAGDVVDLAVAEAIYAIDREGTLFVDPPTAKDGSDGWASRSLGVTEVAAIDVLPAGERA